jgi:membrane protease YdiL (CAAX protease family)
VSGGFSEQISGDCLKMSSKVGLFLLFIGLSFMTFTVGGYNNFPDDVQPFIRTIVLVALAISTYIVKKSEKLHRFWRIVYSFTISSAGLLAAWFLGQWYHLVPGLSISTVEGVAIAKVAEVLPIVIAILAGVWLVDKDMASVFLKGGNIKQSIELGLLFSPLGLIPFFALGGLGINVEANLILTWIPWIITFSIANGLMEELMIRGLFLRKYGAFFGQTGSLFLTSVVFTLFHFGLLEYADFISVSVIATFTFVLGLSWGYIVQKSNSLWGAVLAHMIADALGILAVFGVI